MIVVDCSVLIAGLLPDKVEIQAQSLLEDLQQGRTVANDNELREHPLK